LPPPAYAGQDRRQANSATDADGDMKSPVLSRDRTGPAAAGAAVSTPPPDAPHRINGVVLSDVPYGTEKPRRAGSKPSGAPQG
jgi:hypothetical protein